jgi:hypothetical protein
MAPSLNCTIRPARWPVSASNLKETRVGTNLVWTPLEGFDIGR